MQIPFGTNNGKNYTTSIPLTHIENFSKCFFSHSLEVTMSYGQFGKISDVSVTLTEAEIVVSFYAESDHPSYISQSAVVKGDWRVLEFY